MTVKTYSILISYLIGLPLGFLVISIVYVSPVIFTGEGILMLVLGELLANSIIAMTISFSVSLWFAGFYLFKDISKSKHLMLSSFLYSLRVNSFVWLAFLIMYIIDSNSTTLMLILISPVIAFLLCISISILTNGLLITFLVKKYHNKLK